jgi:hypothetical protein
MAKSKQILSQQVEHPDYYQGKDGAVEVWTAIDSWGLGFCLGNVVKYIARAGKKGDRLTDLLKARQYLEHEIQKEQDGK